MLRKKHICVRLVYLHLELNLNLKGYYPTPALSFGYSRRLRLCVCASVCLCVNYLFVRAIIQGPIKLGSPNLDQKCKTPSLRSLFVLWIDYYLQGLIQPEYP